MVDFSKAVALFKEVTPQGIHTQFNQGFVLYQQLEKDEENIEIGEGQYARVPVMIGENPAVGSRGFMEPTPDADIEEYDSLKVALSYFYGAFIVPGQYLRTKSNAAAFASFMTRQTVGVTMAMKRDYNRQLHGDGTGILATANAGVNSATLPVDDTRHFVRRMQVDVLDRDNGTPAGGAGTGGTKRKIVSIDPVNGTITLDQAVVTAAGPAVTCVYRHKARNKELIGFGAACLDGNPTLGPLHGLDATVITEWRGTRINAAPAPYSGKITEGLLQALDDATDIAVGMNSENEPPLLIGRHADISNYYNSLTGRLRLNDTTTLKSGYKAVTWNGNAFFKDKQAPAGRLRKIPTSVMRLYRMSNWDFMNEDGAVLSRNLDGSDSYTATAYHYSQPGYWVRAALAEAYGLS